MKKLFSFFVAIAFLAIFLSSCNKDETPTGGNTTNQGATTLTITRTPSTPIPIASNNMTADSLDANITFGINAQNVSNIKLNLNNLEGVSVQNLRFALLHNGNEVFVIDTPLTASTSGDMINTILSDSGLTV